jgi:hypothetical protein
LKTSQKPEARRKGEARKRKPEARRKIKNKNPEIGPPSLQFRP